MQQHYVTTWENPTKHMQRFELHSGPGADPEQYEVRPGESVDVLGKYDQAIRTVRDDIVVGGLAPLLVPKGRKELPVHDSIARAAHLGDVERRLVEATGATSGGASLDAVAQLQTQNEELKTQNHAMQQQMAELTAKVQALMGAMVERPAGAPAQAGGPTDPPAPGQHDPPKPAQQPSQNPSRRN